MTIRVPGPDEPGDDNTKEQFAASPDLERKIEDAIIDSGESFRVMSSQALMPKNQKAIKEILLGPAGLYEALRQMHEARQALM